MEYCRCVVCGKLVKYYKSVNPNRKYCSKKCEFEGRKIPIPPNFLEVYDKLKSLKKVADYFGVSPTVSRRWAREKGIKIENRWIKECNPAKRPEVREKTGKRIKKLWKDEEYRKKQVKHLPLRLDKLREGYIKNRDKISKINSERMKKNNPMKNPEIAKKANNSIKMKQKASQHMKNLWENPSFRNKMIKRMKENNPMKNPLVKEKVRRKLKSDPELMKRFGLNRRPNKLEEAVIKIIEKYNFPFKYVGNYQHPIGNKKEGFRYPDFIHLTEKKVILVNGLFWHKKIKDDSKEIIEFYNKFGYEVLILWENEIVKGYDQMKKCYRVRENNVKKKIEGFLCGQKSEKLGGKIEGQKCIISQPIQTKIIS